MNAHLSDSDRQALRLAQDLREEIRAALPQLPSAPSVSPFVDQAGTPSVLLRLDADTARALMALLAASRVERDVAPSVEPRRADGTHVPPPVPPPTAQAVPAAQGPVVTAVSPFGEPGGYEPGGYEPGYERGYGAGYAESPFIPPQTYVGETGPTPLIPSPVYPTR